MNLLREINAWRKTVRERTKKCKNERDRERKIHQPQDFFFNYFDLPLGMIDDGRMTSRTDYRRKSSSQNDLSNTCEQWWWRRRSSRRSTQICSMIIRCHTRWACWNYSSTSMSRLFWQHGWTRCYCCCCCCCSCWCWRGWCIVAVQCCDCRRMIMMMNKIFAGTMGLWETCTWTFPARTFVVFLFRWFSFSTTSKWKCSRTNGCDCNWMRRFLLNRINDRMTSNKFRRWWRSSDRNDRRRRLIPDTRVWFRDEQANELSSTNVLTRHDVDSQASEREKYTRKREGVMFSLSLVVYYLCYGYCLLLLLMLMMMMMMRRETTRSTMLLLATAEALAPGAITPQ